MQVKKIILISTIQTYKNYELNLLKENQLKSAAILMSREPIVFNLTSKISKDMALIPHNLVTSN